MIRRSFVTLVALASLVALPACNEGEPADANQDKDGASHTEPGPYRVVAYLPTYRSLNPARIDFSALTHLCIAFANPTGEGQASDFESSKRAEIAPLVEAAHAAGVKVLASIAGGTKESGELVAAQITPENVDGYVAGLLDVVSRYNLDGIDNDIEGEAINENYETFVKKLRAALPEGALLTAAVATKHGERVPLGALDVYDFVNIMAYDHCSWTDTACDQASIEGVQEDLRYWTEDKKLPYKKTVLGLPFYGWCWGCQDSQTAWTYHQILQNYPQAVDEDWIVDGDRTISHNSAATIRTKSQMGAAYGGVMIWELGQDVVGEDSLLQVVGTVKAEVAAEAGDAATPQE